MRLYHGRIVLARLYFKLYKWSDNVSVRIIDCKAIASDMREATLELLEDCQEAPCLAIVTVGRKSDSEYFVNRLDAACGKTGIDTIHYDFDENTTADEVQQQIRSCVCGETSHVSAILVRIYDSAKFIGGTVDMNDILSELPACMDVEGVSTMYRPMITPPAALGLMQLLFDQYQMHGFEDCKLDGAEVVIYGRSETFCRPLERLMADENATVTICHQGTKNLAEVIQRGDIVIMAGSGLLTGEMVKPGAVVFDCYDRSTDFDSVYQVAGAMTAEPEGPSLLEIEGFLYNTAVLKNIQEATGV